MTARVKHGGRVKGTPNKATLAREAAAAGKPIATVNLGRTRADDLFSLKVAQSCAAALAFLLEDSRVA